MAQLQLALLQFQLSLQHQEGNTPRGGGGGNQPSETPVLHQPSLHPQGRAGGRRAARNKLRAEPRS